jgi:hypothetical protein
VILSLDPVNPNDGTYYFCYKDLQEIGSVSPKVKMEPMKKRKKATERSCVDRPWVFVARWRQVKICDLRASSRHIKH